MTILPIIKTTVRDGRTLVHRIPNTENEPTAQRPQSVSKHFIFCNPSLLI
jgi:hypothetical protein